MDNIKLKEKQFNIAKDIVLQSINSLNYKKEKMPMPDNIIDYNEDEDSKTVFNDWTSGKSKVITICTFNKNDNYKDATNFIIKKFFSLKKDNPNISGFLKMSDKYDSSADLNFKT